MKSIPGNVAASLIILAGVGGYPAVAAQERSADAQGIEQLKASGSDLAALHQIEFTLRFPTQMAAEGADLQLLGFAFVTKIEPGRSGEERVIRATKRMLPVESDLAGLRDKLDAIAASGRGAYEGWKAKPAAVGR